MRHRGLLAVGAIALGGCGGGESAEEFRARADRVCADTRAAVDNVGEARTLDGLRKLAPKVRRRATDGLAELKALGDPPDGVEGWSELLGALEAQLPLLERLGTVRDATAAEQVAVQGRALEARAVAAAKRTGVRTCGTAPASPGG